MKSSTALALGGLGALAWYLSKQATGAPVGVGGAGLGPGGLPLGSTPSPDELAVVGDSYIGQPDYFLDYGRLYDLCNIPNDRRDTWSAETNACASKWHQDRANLWAAQVWAPASRVPITSLTADDYKLAFNFLTNRLDRRNVPLTYGQSKRIDDFNNAIGWAATLNDVIFKIVDAFTFGLASLALKPLGNSITRSIDKSGELREGESVSDYIARKQAEFTSAVKAVPGLLNGADLDLAHIEDAPEHQADPYYGQFWHQGTDAVRVDPSAPSFDIGYDPLRFPWGLLWARVGLFRHSDDGNNSLKYGWISKETGYEGVTDKTASPYRIAKIARLYRVLDVLGCLLKPNRIAYIVGNNADPNADSVGVDQLSVLYKVPDGLFAYKVAGVELWGACLPACPEDNATDLAGIIGKTLARQAYVGDIPVESPATQIAKDYVPHVPAPPSDLSPFVSPVVAPSVIASSYIPVPDAGAQVPAAAPAVFTKANRRR